MDSASMNALTAACRTVVTSDGQRLIEDKERRNRETMAMMIEDIADAQMQRDKFKGYWMGPCEI